MGDSVGARIGRALLFIIVGLPVLAFVCAALWTMSPLLLIVLPPTAAFQLLRTPGWSIGRRVAMAALAIPVTAAVLVGFVAPVHAVALHFTKVNERSPGWINPVVALAGFCFGLLWLAHALKVLARMRRMDRMKTTLVAEAPLGPAEFVGVVRVAEPIRQRIWSRIQGDVDVTLPEPPGDAVVRAEKRVSGSGKHARSLERIMCRSFYLEDESGRILVDPAGAWPWNPDDIFRLGNRAHVVLPDPATDDDGWTATLRVGAKVYLMGVVTEDREAPAGSKGAERLIVRAVPGKLPDAENQPVTLEMFQGMADALGSWKAEPGFLLSDRPEPRTHSALLRGVRVAGVMAAIWLILPGMLAWRSFAAARSARQEEAKRLDDRLARWTEELEELEDVWPYSLAERASGDPVYARFLVESLSGGDECVVGAARVLSARRDAVSAEEARGLLDAAKREGGRTGAVVMQVALLRLQHESGAPWVEEAITAWIATAGTPGIPEAERRSLDGTVVHLVSRHPGPSGQAIRRIMAATEPPARRKVAIDLATQAKLDTAPLAVELNAAAADGDAGLRAAALHAMVTSRNPTSFQAEVSRGLGDSSAEVRGAALGYYDQVEGLHVIPVIERLFADPDPSIRRRVHVFIHKCRGLVDGRLIPHLRGILRSGADPEGRAEAARTLGCLHDTESTVPLLIEALEDRDARVRRAAAESLGRRGHDADEARRTLEALRGDADTAVGQAAERALKALDHPPLKPAPKDAPVVTFKQTLPESMARPSSDEARVVVIRTADELKRLAPELGIRPASTLYTSVEKEVLVVVTGGPRPALHFSVHVTRVTRSDGGLILEVARSRTDRAAIRREHHPYVVLTFAKDEFPGIRGCVESNGAPWHGTIEDR